MSKNVKWKVAVPGLGHSSPIVWGDKVFVTTAVSTDPKEDYWEKGFPRIERKPDAAEISWKVLCFDRDTGKLLWDQTAIRKKPANARHTKKQLCLPDSGDRRSFHLCLLWRPGNLLL